MLGSHGRSENDQGRTQHDREREARKVHLHKQAERGQCDNDHGRLPAQGQRKQREEKDDGQGGEQCGVRKRPSLEDRERIRRGQERGQQSARPKNARPSRSVSAMAATLVALRATTANAGSLAIAKSRAIR